MFLFWTLSSWPRIHQSFFFDTFQNSFKCVPPQLFGQWFHFLFQLCFLLCCYLDSKCPACFLGWINCILIVRARTWLREKWSFMWQLITDPQKGIHTTFHKIDVIHVITDIRGHVFLQMTGWTTKEVKWNKVVANNSLEIHTWKKQTASRWSAA